MAKPVAGKKYQIPRSKDSEGAALKKSPESVEDRTRVDEALFTDFRDLELQSSKEFRINITLRERGLAYIDNRVPIIWTSDSESRPVSRVLRYFFSVPAMALTRLYQIAVYERCSSSNGKDREHGSHYRGLCLLGAPMPQVKGILRRSQPFKVELIGKRQMFSVRGINIHDATQYGLQQL
ncbi:hypothetical protein B0H19DRAFT_1061219 [Mycena capillaripes]|nr:hypothetical protein B0H19DRAFT_1061219 [Mycena capillaripes]